MIQPQTIALAVGAVAVVALAAYIAKKGVAGAVAGAVGAVGDAATGAVIGIGQTIGIPQTNKQRCADAIREGRTWDSSFDCDAAAFTSGAWQRLKSTDYGNPENPPFVLNGTTGGSTNFTFPI